LLPGAGYGLGINALELLGGVTIYSHGGGVPRYLAGILFMRDTGQHLVVSFIIVSGERSVPDYGAGLSLVLRPVRYD
jgi:hypothetical protein